MDENEHLTPTLPIGSADSAYAEREKRSQRHPGSRHLPLGAADKDSVKMHPWRRT
jgi:hypothetical protein